MNDLKPCPFCGEEAKLYSSPYRTFYAADCTNCGASIENEDYDEVFAQWNRRAEPTAEQTGSTWTPVEEALPARDPRYGSYSEDVLVRLLNGRNLVACCNYTDCISWDFGGVNPRSEVTHWMPLPEPEEVTSDDQ